MSDKSYRYKLHGFDLESEIELPFAFPSASLETDIRIRLGEVPELLEGAERSGLTWQSKGSEFLIKIPRVGNYWIKDAHNISVESATGAAPEVLGTFALYLPWALCLLERGILPLDGAAVEARGETNLLLGRSASGKSSLALALSLRGHRVLCDQTSAVHLSLGLPQIWPECSALQVWLRTLNHFSLPPNESLRVRSERTKYFWPLPAEIKPTQSPLARIIILEPTSTDKLETTRLSNQEAVLALRCHTVGHQVVSRTSTLKRFLGNLATISKAVPVSVLTYPLRYQPELAARFLEQEWER